MSTIGAAIAKEPNPEGRCVGIEIEVENCKVDNAVLNDLTPWWTYKADHSLRNYGAEWVTPPIQYDSVKEALELFYDVFTKRNFHGSGRAGIHVHIDCRPFTIAQIQQIATAYCLVEPAFFNFVGAIREENIYCVPFYRADSDVLALGEALSTYNDSSGGMSHIRSFLQSIRTRTCKYSALYFEPLARFGTVEFRHAPTWENSSRVRQWVDLCWNLVEYATTQPSAAAILAQYNQTTPALFAAAVLHYSKLNSLVYNEKVAVLDTEALAQYLVTPVENSADGWVRIEPNWKVHIPKAEKLVVSGPKATEKVWKNPFLTGEVSSSFITQLTQAQIMEAEMLATQAGASPEAPPQPQWQGQSGFIIEDDDGIPDDDLIEF